MAKTSIFRGVNPNQNEVAIKVTNIINADRKESVIRILQDGCNTIMFRTINERLVGEPGLMSRLGDVTEEAVTRVEAHQRMGDMVVTVMEMGERTLMDVINR